MNKYLPWLLWLFTVLGMVFGLIETLQSNDKTLFLPGQTSTGHYQIELQCDACHGESFSDMKVMQQKCVDCHGKELKQAKDSHPKSKFTDPRNADRIAILDARYCVTCHVEHKPEITRSMGVTLPEGYCLKCHLEVADDRPSHQGLGFETCASSGCHNYHDNRALYEDFLVKHADDSELKLAAGMPAITAHEQYFEQHPALLPLTGQDQDAPDSVLVDDRVLHDWAHSSHARAGVNCTDCHNDKDKQVWLDQPTHEQCRDCHQTQVSGFLEGKHGMRLNAGMTPMQPKLARLEFNPLKADKQLTCASCHSDHEFNSAKAAIEACSSCHVDEHSRNYKQSKHYQLWLQEQGSQAVSKSGASCATCHMPALQQTVNYASSVATQHNQNHNLRPNEKMIRSVCMNCHSLAFSIDALVDQSLIDNNFSSQPSVHIESIDMAIARVK